MDKILKEGIFAFHNSTTGTVRTDANFRNHIWQAEEGNPRHLSVFLSYREKSLAVTTNTLQVMQSQLIYSVV